MTPENPQSGNGVPQAFREAIDELDENISSFFEEQEIAEKEYEFEVNYYDVQYFSNVFERVKPELLRRDREASKYRPSEEVQIEKISRRLKVAENSRPVKDITRFTASVSDMDFIKYRTPNTYSSLPFKETEICREVTKSLLESFKKHLRNIGDTESFKKMFPGENFRNWWKLG